jgi:putative SOS response-associated peptidase YedK
MFDRYLLVSDIKRIQSQLGIAKIPCSSPYIPSYNIGFDDEAYVMANYQTKEMEPFKFGLKGIGETKYFVRAEGKRNLNDDPRYSGSNAIFLMPEFSKIIRSQRCLVLADAFVVGLDNNAPQLIYMRDKQRPFAFAGIWNKTINESVEPEYSFAIITTTSNSLLAGFGLKRMPVILNDSYFNRWINPSAPLGEILSMLYPCPTDKMNAYPISSRIADKSLNNKSLVKPVGKSMFEENIGVEIKNWGWRRKNNFSTDQTSWGERRNLVG